jgi:hypothetical protein
MTPARPAGSAGWRTFWNMKSGICDRLRAWGELYPNPSASAELNAAARAAEDRKLAQFAGLAELSREQAIELVDFKFQSMAHRRALAMRGIKPERWNSAAELIRAALAAIDDQDALGTICRIHRFGPAMGSAVLAACRPERFTIADVRALKATRGLGLMADGPPGFRLADWMPYLDACRTMASQCGQRLRDVDRALWVAGGDPHLVG